MTTGSPRRTDARARPTQAKQSTPRSRDRPKETYGGVDAEGNSKQELYDRAKKLGVEGRSDMSKHELAKAIQKKQ